MHLYLRMALATLDQQGCSWQLPGHMYLRGDYETIMHWLKSWLVVLKCILLVKLWEALSAVPCLNSPLKYVTSISYELIERNRKLVTYNSQGMRVAGVTSWWMQSEPAEVSEMKVKPYSEFLLPDVLLGVQLPLDARTNIFCFCL